MYTTDHQQTYPWLDLKPTAAHFATGIAQSKSVTEPEDGKRNSLSTHFSALANHEHNSQREAGSGRGFKQKMAAGKEAKRNKQNHRDTFCNVVISHETCPRSQPIIFNPDFFVEKLRHEKPDVFMELVLSNITRLIDLPGTEFAQLLGQVDPKLHSGTGVAAGFLRSLNFLKRKDKGVIFGAPLTEEGIAQIYQLIEYLHKNLQVEGLFRVPGNSIRQQALKECLNSGIDIDLDSGEYHPYLTAYDLQENMMRLNYGMAFMIKHSQKIFRAPVYIREHARIEFSGSRIVQSKDDLDLLPSQGSKGLLPSKRNCIDPPCSQPDDSRYHTEEALKELFRHVHNMPESAKKKKIVRQRKLLGNQFVMEKENKNVTPEVTTCSSGQIDKACKENINLNVESCSLTNICVSPTHESSV
ncbi:UNVERIFIED_CONTAM: hypothetical protein FKN15_028605 [Acipenser sinensis]